MTLERTYIVHPKQVIVTLAIAAITALFIAFCASYLYNRFNSGIPPVKLPNLFYFNSIFLVLCSYLLNLAKKSYLTDQTSSFKLQIGLTILVSIVFLVLQVYAWRKMIEMNIFLNEANTGSYLYLISGMHFLHVLGGIPFLIVFFSNAIIKMQSPVSVLIYFSDPDKKRDLELLSWYWHFLDILWIALVLFFGVNYFLQ